MLSSQASYVVLLEGEVEDMAGRHIPIHASEDTMATPSADVLHHDWCQSPAQPARRVRVLFDETVGRQL